MIAIFQDPFGHGWATVLHEMNPHSHIANLLQVLRSPRRRTTTTYRSSSSASIPARGGVRSGVPSLNNVLMLSATLRAYPADREQPGHMRPPQHESQLKCAKG